MSMSTGSWLESRWCECEECPSTGVMVVEGRGMTDLQIGDSVPVMNFVILQCLNRREKSQSMGMQVMMVILPTSIINAIIDKDNLCFPLVEAWTVSILRMLGPSLEKFTISKWDPDGTS